MGWQSQGNAVAWNAGPPRWYATNAVGHYDIDLLDVLATFMGFAREKRPRAIVGDHIYEVFCAYNREFQD
eukprot:10246147-Prorocentrum_lima.AAC.1